MILSTFKMIDFVTFLYLLISLHRSFAQNECPINYHCNNTHISEDNKVVPFCKKSQELSMIGRCCTNDTTIIGLDLRYCDIKKLKISNTNFSFVEILDLRDNDFEKFTHENLIGLKKLDYLYLPAHIPCPGGNAAWNFTSVDNYTTFCSHQLNYCTSLNVTCGDSKDANCHHLGPGTARCICTSGHFGYKCLNEGEFPTVACCTSIIIPTIVLSIVLWFVQGRDPYRQIRTEE